MTAEVAHPKQTTLARISRVLCETLTVPAEKVTMGAHLVDDLGADSLDLIEIGMILEEEFDVEIGDAEVDRFRRVSDVVRAVAERQAAKAAAA